MAAATLFNSGETKKANADESEAERIDPDKAFECKRFFYDFHRLACYTETLRINPDNAAAYEGRGTEYSS